MLLIYRIETWTLREIDKQKSTSVRRNMDLKKNVKNREYFRPKAP